MHTVPFPVFIPTPSTGPGVERDLLQYHSSHSQYMSYVEPFTVRERERGREGGKERG